jgi:hypothetical protein
MSSPYISGNTYYRHQHLRTRRPQTTQLQVGEVTRQRANSAPSPNSPGLDTHFLNWLTGTKPTPGYQVAAAAGLLNQDTVQRIEDLRAALQAQLPRQTMRQNLLALFRNPSTPTKLQLLVKDHVNIPSDMDHQTLQRRKRALFRNCKTEFFLNLEDAKNLPADLKRKYCNPDSADETASMCSDVLSDGIGFMVPNQALPPNFQPNNNEDIKAWLGLSSKVDFDLFGNRRSYTF